MNNIYDWNKVESLIKVFLPELIEEQREINNKKVHEPLPKENRKELLDLGFSNEGKLAEDVTRFLLDKVYPYRMRTNHPRYFCFIPSDITPYSVLGDFINSIHNPYVAGVELSEGVVELEKETIKWMGSQIGYDVNLLGGQFTSGGSMANLTGLIVGRDDKLKPEEFIKGTLYTSDQTHSSVAKAAHLMGIPRKNVRIIDSDENFKIKLDKLEKAIQQDIKEGYIPFAIIGSSGTTNTGAIDDLEKLGYLAKKYNLWFHVDGAYGASALLSDSKNLFKGIENADSVSWDGHKWLFQTYGCAAIICKDGRKLLETFSVNPEYLEDVQSTDLNPNFWDTGIEMTKPARGMRLWYTLQILGIDKMREAINKGILAAKWIEEEVSKYENLEIVSPAQLGIINFRYKNNKFSEKKLNEINKRISQEAMNRNYAAFLTTTLKDKVVLRFCVNNPLIKKEEIINIVNQIQEDILNIENAIS